MQVKEIMSSGVEWIAPDTTLRDAALKMRQRDIGMLPIGENDRLIGTVTDRDIVIGAVAEGRDPTAAPVREVMSGGIAYVFEDQSLEEAAEIMGDRQIRRLPVLNRDKRLVGMVAMADLAAKSDAKEPVAEALGAVSH